MRIGVAGLGRMGAAIAARLMETGHDVRVWNRTPGKAEELVAAGAKLADDPESLAASVEAIVSILSDGAALAAVYEGPTGLLAGDITGKVVIEMSTVRPAEAKALAARVRAKGAAHVECPVGGTVGPARQGKLLGMAGCSQEEFERAKPLLDQLCRRVERVGEAGAGSAMKLAINLPLLVAYQALGEAYILCRGLGLDPGWVMEFFSDTSGAPNVLKTRAPAIAQSLAGKAPPPPAFTVDLIRKDLRTMIAEARSLGASLPLAERTLAVYDDAAREGWGERDGTVLPSYWPGKQPA